MPRTAKKPTATGGVGGAGQSAGAVTPARVQPISTPTGQPYGEAKALADAQRQLPLPNNSEPVMPAGGMVAGGSGGGTGLASNVGNPVAPVAPGGAGVDPGALSAAARADTSPPIGLGQPIRPGEVGHPNLMLPPTTAPDTVGALINQLAPTSSDLQYLAAYVNAGNR